MPMHRLHRQRSHQSHQRKYHPVDRARRGLAEERVEARAEEDTEEKEAAVVHARDNREPHKEQHSKATRPR